MLKSEEVDALLNKPQHFRVATSDEVAIFLKQLKRLPQSKETQELLEAWEKLEIFIDINDNTNYSFALKHPQDPYTLNDSWFMKLK